MNHLLVVPTSISKVEGPRRFGPKKSKRSWCPYQDGGHLYDADRFYAALKSPLIDWEEEARNPYSQTGLFYEPHWSFACEECARKLGWVGGEEG